MFTLHVKLTNGNESEFDFFTEAEAYFYSRRMLENSCIAAIWITNDKDFSTWLKEKQEERAILRWEGIA